MKSGLVLTLWALRALLEPGHSLPGPLWVFCNSDEEIGSSASKDRILQLSQEAWAVLVAEPAEAVTGSLKATRKGNGHYHVHIKGKAAHAGNDPLGGISAVEEMAHQILHLHALAAVSYTHLISFPPVPAPKFSAPTHETEADTIDSCLLYTSATKYTITIRIHSRVNQLKSSRIFS